MVKKLPITALLINLLFISNQINAGCLVDPVDKPLVTSPYGKQRTAADVGQKNYKTSVHQGLDFVSQAGNRGAKIYAGAAGVVHYADFAGGYGNTIIIKRTDEKAGEFIAYRHLRSFNVRKGAPVVPGQVIGIMGGSGSKDGRFSLSAWPVHLHNDYMVPNRNNAVQYEFSNRTKQVAGSFVSLGGKQPGEWRAGGAYFTDPSPYYCNTFTIRSGSASPWAKDTKAQYQFILTKLGKTNSVAAGQPPTIGDYASAQQAEYSLANCEENADVAGTNAAPGIPL